MKAWLIMCSRCLQYPYLNRSRCVVDILLRVYKELFFSSYISHCRMNFFVERFLWSMSAIMTLLKSVFNHLILPPKFSRHQDTNIEEIEQCILFYLRQACDILDKFAGQIFQKIWAFIDDFLCACMNVIKSRLKTTSILKTFQQFQSKHFLILHMMKQNAALFFRHHIRLILQFKFTYKFRLRQTK